MIDRGKLALLLNRRRRRRRAVLTLHRHQLPLVRSRARFRVAACGRRWGKTTAGCACVIHAALRRGHPFRALWVAPTHDQADEAVDIILPALRQAAVGTRWLKGERRLELENGACVFFRSAEIPRNLRGRGWDLVVVDEAAYVPDAVWYEVLRPALADRRGRGLFLSTPNGARGWFHAMYLRGEDGHQREVRSWRLPSWQNPLLARAEIAALRRTLPERVFRQEIEVEFLEGEGVVFATIPAEDYALPRPAEGRVVIGADLAKHEDFTVLVALDESGRLVDFKRMRRIDYTAQAEVIAGMSHRLRAPVYLDATGVGQAVLELVSGRGVEVVPVVFTHEAKRQLVQNLVVAFERRLVVVPAGLEVLMRELASFAARSVPGGVVYSAPPGLHDDCVVALALAAWALRRPGQPAAYEEVAGSFV